MGQIKNSGLHRLSNKQHPKVSFFGNFKKKNGTKARNTFVSFLKKRINRGSRSNFFLFLRVKHFCPSLFLSNFSNLYDFCLDLFVSIISYYKLNSYTGVNLISWIDKISPVFSSERAAIGESLLTLKSSRIGVIET